MDSAALQARVEVLEGQLAEVVIERDANKVVVQSLRKLADHEMRTGKRCRVCGHAPRHAGTCYLLASTGYDLLNEHEATLRENSELRAALAKHLPVNGKQIVAGASYRSHRTRLRERLAKKRRP